MSTALPVAFKRASASSGVRLHAASKQHVTVYPVIQTHIAPWLMFYHGPAKINTARHSERRFIWRSQDKLTFHDITFLLPLRDTFDICLLWEMSLESYTQLLCKKKTKQTNKQIPLIARRHLSKLHYGSTENYGGFERRTVHTIRQAWTPCGKVETLSTSPARRARLASLPFLHVRK